MTAKQTVTITKKTTVKTTKAKRGVAAVSQPKRKAGRPKGSKDTKPRKPRSDKGKKRGAYKKRSNGEVRA